MMVRFPALLSLSIAASRKPSSSSYNCCSSCILSLHPGSPCLLHVYLPWGCSFLCPMYACCTAAFYAFWDAHTQSASSSGRLYEQLQQLVAQAEELVEPNAFGAMLQKSGAVGLNATTSHDATKYFMSLPANMLELWFALEAERFQVCPSTLSRLLPCRLYPFVPADFGTSCTEIDQPSGQWPADGW